MAYQPRPPRQALCRTCGTAWMVSGRGATPKYCSDGCKPKYESRPYDPATGAAAMRRRYWANPDKFRARQREYMRERRKDLPFAIYDPTYAERQRRWRKNNPERWAELQHRRRARLKSNGAYQVSDRDLARLGRTPCVGCGTLENLEVDHIIPISRGGSHGIGNLQSLCRSCNASKNNKLQMEWLVARGELDERIRPASS